LQTATVQSRLSYVRRPQAVEPLMEKYYDKHGIYPLTVLNFDRVEARSIDGRPFWYAVASTPESSEIVLLEKVGDEFKVDWETHVGLNPISPDEYVEKRPSGKMEFRVYVSPDDYYNGPFADSEKYLSAKLEFANSSVVLFGYLEKKSPDYTKFLKLVDQAKRVALILSLEWPEPAADKSSRLSQVHIRELVAERWLFLD
jgi:hypothetical protein